LFFQVPTKYVLSYYDTRIKYYWNNETTSVDGIHAIIALKKALFPYRNLNPMNCMSVICTGSTKENPIGMELRIQDNKWPWNHLKIFQSDSLHKEVL
jgi:hypothetical protein